MSCIRCACVAFALFVQLSQGAPRASLDASVRFTEVDTLFANPGQGWMTQRRAPDPKPRFPASVVYTRFNWVDAEPEQGHYNWDVLDRVVQAWKPLGATVAFRVMTCNAHSAGYYASPKWLFDAGCKGHDYLRGGDDPTSGGKRITRIEPEYSDPLYLESHARFIKALGARYDGSPYIEFLDIGSYGIWGEWHTSHPAPVEIRKKIVDMYLDAFRRTPLVFMSDDAEVLAYALSKGTGFRRDGVGSPWHEQNWIGSKKYAAVQGMADVWRKAPVVFEWFGNYEYLLSRSWSFDAAVNFMLSNHVSLINDNVGTVPPEAMPQLEKLARLAGARLVVREIKHSRRIYPDGVLTIQSSWANVGVGKLYRPFRFCFALLDNEGKVACSKVSSTDPRAWFPGDHDLSEKLDVPSTVVPGTYKLAVSLTETDPPRRPFHLAIDAKREREFYLLSEVVVE